MKENIPAQTEPVNAEEIQNTPVPDDSTGTLAGQKTNKNDPARPRPLMNGALKALIALVGVLLVAAATYGIGSAIRKNDSRPQVTNTTKTPVPAGMIQLPAYQLPDSFSSINRISSLDTEQPLLPRYETTQYEVVTGDSVFAIAEKFGLRPETIMWANYEILHDNPTLQPGMVLNILPVDGLYYYWHNGDSMEKIAAYYGVKPEDILNFPGNHLDITQLGDPIFPNIPESTMIIVPGGTRTYISWAVSISRDNPGIARIMGPGACDATYGGPVAGDPPYAWPALWTYLSGYDYTPETNHLGIDIGGRTGHPITSIADGVVVYAGWNYGGYGNVVVVDHGNGYQSIYAHLDSFVVQCGSWVYTGSLLGTMGSTGRSTGPHLHFEIQNNDLGRVNPWNYLIH